MQKNVVVIAGPTGSGKDSVIKGVLAKIKGAKFLTNVTTRKQREGEVDGINYHFITNDRFLEELKVGNILEYYHREDTDTYYGTYKPDLDEKIKDGNITFSQIQIVGAKYLKENYGATTIFILPPSIEELKKRVIIRGDVSAEEWQERLKHFRREMSEDIDFYDYKITNEDGKLEQTVNHVLQILKDEGYNLI